jgi:hypothetical protein
MARRGLRPWRPVLPRRAPPSRRPPRADSRASMSDTVKARWVAGYHAVLPDGTELVPGGEYRIPAGEADQSDNWQPVAKPSPKPDKEG